MRIAAHMQVAGLTPCTSGRIKEFTRRQVGHRYTDSASNKYPPIAQSRGSGPPAAVVQVALYSPAACRGIIDLGARSRSIPASEMDEIQSDPSSDFEWRGPAGMAPGVTGPGDGVGARG